jgi:hypothetical protein|tara:strand:+ start:650 stop:856 length:207 start_codon:yes stop_codon:yes gene_type:complete
MTKDKKNKRHQVKSKFYYIFWGTATFSVLVGQLYVGTGYRSMADALSTGFEISVICGDDGPKWLGGYK